MLVYIQWRGTIEYLIVIICRRKELANFMRKVDCSYPCVMRMCRCQAIFVDCVISRKSFEQQPFSFFCSFGSRSQNFDEIQFKQIAFPKDKTHLIGR